MVSRRKIIYGAVSLLVLLGVILGILGGLGVFSGGRTFHPSSTQPSPSSFNPQKPTIFILDFEQLTGTVRYTLNNPNGLYITDATINMEVYCSGDGCSNINNKINFFIPMTGIPTKSGTYSFTNSQLIIPVSDAQRTASVKIGVPTYDQGITQTFPIQ
jgi:hypothetical protein